MMMMPPSTYTFLSYYYNSDPSPTEALLLLPSYVRATIISLGMAAAAGLLLVRRAGHLGWPPACLPSFLVLVVVGRSVNVRATTTTTLMMMVAYRPPLPSVRSLARSPGQGSLPP